MEYNKLVRDKILRIIKESGKVPLMHIADDKEYKEKLKEKLKEEVNEFLEKNSIEEMIDIFEVMMTINTLNGWYLEQILELKEKKIKERGAFEKRIILDKVE